MVDFSKHLNRPKMAKKGSVLETVMNHGKPSADKPKRKFLREDLVTAEKVENSTRFWNFQKHKSILCEILGTDEETMEHKVFLVREYESEEEFFLPNHKSIADAYEQYGSTRIYEITHEETVPFKEGKRKFNVYKIQLYKLPS